MKTPCIAICKNQGGICTGCHRTLSEIAQWAQFSDEQRTSVLEQLEQRRSTHHCPNCGQAAHCDIAAGKKHCWCFDLEERDCTSVNDNALCVCRHCLTAQPIR